MEREYFEDLETLQVWTDKRVDEGARQQVCPATGQRVWESWEKEIPFLRALPEELPEPFDLVKTCQVNRDCTIPFEGRRYVVPFRYVLKSLEARGCVGKVQIFDPQTGQMVKSYQRGTAARLLIDEDCYVGEGVEAIMAPKPLGRMGKRLQEIAQMPVEKRPMDLYAALAEVAR